MFSSLVLTNLSRSVTSVAVLLQASLMTWAVNPFPSAWSILAAVMLRLRELMLTCPCLSGVSNDVKVALEAAVTRGGASLA